MKIKSVEWSTCDKNVREEEKRKKSKLELFRLFINCAKIDSERGSIDCYKLRNPKRNYRSSPWRPAAMGQGEKPWNVTGRILWLSYLWHASALSKKNAAPGINNRRWWNSFCRESREGGFCDSFRYYRHSTFGFIGWSTSMESLDIMINKFFFSSFFLYRNSNSIINFSTSASQYFPPLFYLKCKNIQITRNRITNRKSWSILEHRVRKRKKRKENNLQYSNSETKGSKIEKNDRRREW